MTSKKTALPILLMLCIAMLPLQSLNAGSVDHMESMLVDCPSGDKDSGVAHEPCDEAQCIMTTGFCGAQNATSILSRSHWMPMPGSSFVGYGHAFSSRYRSHLDFSIYRPPIA